MNKTPLRGHRVFVHELDCVSCVTDGEVHRSVKELSDHCDTCALRASANCVAHTSNLSRLAYSGIFRCMYFDYTAYLQLANKHFSCSAPSLNTLLIDDID